MVAKHTSLTRTKAFDLHQFVKRKIDLKCMQGFENLKKKFSLNIFELSKKKNEMKYLTSINKRACKSSVP
jgi:hypothetical protein